MYTFVKNCCQEIAAIFIILGFYISVIRNRADTAVHKLRNSGDRDRIENELIIQTAILFAIIVFLMITLSFFIVARSEQRINDLQTHLLSSESTSENKSVASSTLTLPLHAENLKEEPVHHKIGTPSSPQQNKDETIDRSDEFGCHSQASSEEFLDIAPTHARENTYHVDKNNIKDHVSSSP